MLDASGSTIKLPVYTIVIMVILALIILCGTIGIVYYIRNKKCVNSYPNTTVEMNNAAASLEPANETMGRESAVYDEIDKPSNYQALYTDVDEPVMETETMNNTTQYEDVSNITQKTQGPHYVNTDFNLK